MKHRSTPAKLLVAIVCMLATITPAMAMPDNQTGSGGAAADAQKGVVTRTVSPARQRAALRFWTREKMRDTKALEMPAQAIAVAADQSADASADMLSNSATPAGFSGPGFAAPNADAVSKEAYAADWAALATDATLDGGSADQSMAAVGGELTGTSQVYSSYIANWDANMQRIYPHRWVGRMSFATASGTSYCSATTISNNTIVTAAHCLYDTTNNRWYSNWVFAPAYRNGNAPYGTFAASTCWVLSTWVNLSGSYTINSWARHDVGVCRMGRNSAAQTLNQAVGWAGRQWNWPYVRHYHSLGYPFRDYNTALLPYAGLYLRTCVAESFTQTTDTRGMGCNLGGGISGGPWLIGYSPGAISGAVDGVNSGLYIGQQNLYAGRFTSNNIVVLCTAAAC